MPWNKGGGRGGGKGSWGPGPGGNRGQTPPDLDELIRKGQNSVRRTLSGGSGGRSTWVIFVLAIIALIAFNSIYQVQADERGVVLRLGSHARTVDPGLHFAIWPFETFEIVQVESERQTSIGATAKEGLILAGDQNLVDVRFTVLWNVKDPETFLFDVSDQEKLVKVVAESAMREIVGRTPAEEVRTTGRLVAQDAVMSIVQTALDSYSAGILITGVKLEKADPPAEVLDAFEEVQRAEQDQARLINEADQYANQRRRLVEGEAAKIIEDAKGYKARVTLEARGEAQRFLSVYEQYKNAQDVTRQRIFLETLEDILAQSNNVILEGGKGQGGVPYLPLPEIQRRQNAMPQAQGANP